MERMSKPNETFKTIRAPRVENGLNLKENFPFEKPEDLDFYDVLQGRALVKLYSSYHQECFNKGYSVNEILKEASLDLDYGLGAIYKHFELDKFDYLTMLAVGGYGRNEQFLRSDIDLLIASKIDPIPDEAKEKIESFISFLWDLNLDLGVSVRSILDTVIASREDITIITNLIENHFIAGDYDTYIQLLKAVENDNFWDDEKYFDAKYKEQIERYHTYRDTVYSLEPDIKNNPGGLRDLHIMQWIAIKIYKAKIQDNLYSVGLLNAKEYQEYLDCRKYIFDVRYALHCINNSNILRLDLQKDLAALLGYGENGNEPVEAMMRDLFRIFHRVRELNNIVLQQAQLTIKGFVGDNYKESVFINSSFVQKGNYIDVLDHELFKHDPSKILELFYCIEQRHEITQIHVNCLRALRESRRELKTHLITLPDARKIFSNLLKKAVHAPKIFRLMHEARILSVYMPQWERIEGLAQFDRFHLFSVDEHTVRVILNVVALSQNTDPIFNLYRKIYKKISNLKLLITAAFLHDIGKGCGGNHAQKGAKDAESFCRLHNFSDYETHMVSFLVKSHLQFNTIATRRDISDLEVINDFAEFVKDEEHLNLLYCLTVADMCSTNDTVWNSWKDNIFRQLYQSTLLALSHDGDLEESRREQIQECQSKICNMALDGELSNLLKYIRQFPSEYFIHYSPEQIYWHARNILRFTHHDEPLVLFSQNSNYATELLLYYKSDASKMFGNVLRTMALKQLNVLSAQLFLTHDYHVLCTLLFQNKKGLPLDNDRLSTTRRSILLGINDESYELELKAPDKEIFDLPTKISYLDSEQGKQTRLEISTLDRQGLLAKIGLTLGSLNYLINAARITTTGERADDYFAITDSNGMPLDEAKKQELSYALEKALA